MFKQQLAKLSTAAVIAMGLSLAPISLLQAQTLGITPDLPQARFYDDIIPAGTVIALESSESEKILLLPGESLSITLQVAQDVRDDLGRVIIPRGAEISGTMQPEGNGTRFIAEYLYLRDGNSYPLDAVSRLITRREVIEAGGNNRAILQGAVAGAAAATIISGITGDQKIRAPEILGGAGLGALIGYAFGSGPRSQELISINPNRDLDITLRSDLVLANPYNQPRSL